jgi:hypothetical protein
VVARALPRVAEVATPAPAASAVEPKPVEAVPTPASVELRLAVAPSHARIVVDGHEVAVGSGSLALAKGSSVRVVAEAEGFEPRTETVLVDSDLRIEWVLVPLEKPKEATPKAPSAPPKAKHRERAVHSDLVNPLD